MNERIQELANQAGLFVDFNGQTLPRALSADECVAAYKQFAELIVQECIDIAYREGDNVDYLASTFGVE